MMIYLPIAEMSVDIFMLLALGGVAGVLSGLFGIGGGFLMTPLLIFIGVPPMVAVASSANQIVASSVSSFIVHWHQRNVDFKIGLLLLAGGLVGSTIGVKIFSYLAMLGQIDLVIALSYVVLLSIIGALMSVETLNSIVKKRKSSKLLSTIPDTIISAKADVLSEMPSNIIIPKNDKKYLIQRLPLQHYFPKSNLWISLCVPPMIGLVVGVLVSIMGIGGGFFMIPAMIYLLKMPIKTVVGTSLFQVIFVTANVTILHAVNTQTVDVVLSLFLLIGSVISSQIFVRLARYLPTEYLRGLLALIIISVAIKLAYGLLSTPDNMFSVILENVR